MSPAGTEAVVGVDLGATNIRAAVVRPDGSMGPRLKHDVPRGGAPEVVTRAVAALCRDAAREADSEVGAVGVGLAGWLEAESGVVHNGPNLGWRDVPFGRLLTSALDGTPVVLTNDLRAIAWGEYLFGAGAGSALLAVVFLGSGIGSSVIMDGKPLSGATNVACELGHVRVVPAGGRACGCGQLGCLEAYVGGHNIERRLRHELETGVSSSLSLAKGDRTCDAVEAAARAGDQYSLALWAEVAGYLGQAIGSLITYLNPDRLIIGGGLWSGAATLREQALPKIEAATSPTAYEACKIVEPKLGDAAGIMGAAAMARTGQ